MCRGVISESGVNPAGCLTFRVGLVYEQEQVFEGEEVPLVRARDAQERVHEGPLPTVEVRCVPAGHGRGTRGPGAQGRVPRVHRMGHRQGVHGRGRRPARYHPSDVLGPYRVVLERGTGPAARLPFPPVCDGGRDVCSLWLVPAGPDR